MSLGYKCTSNFDQYLICPSGDNVVGCARYGMGFEVNLYVRKYKFRSDVDLCQICPSQRMSL